MMEAGKPGSPQRTDDHVTMIRAQPLGRSTRTLLSRGFTSTVRRDMEDSAGATSLACDEQKVQSLMLELGAMRVERGDRRGPGLLCQTGLVGIAKVTDDCGQLKLGSTT